MKIFNNILLIILIFCSNHIKWTNQKIQKGKRENSIYFSGFLCTVKFKQTNIPETYTREELIEMLYIIRKQEKIMNWKVPEISK